MIQPTKEVTKLSCCCTVQKPSDGQVDGLSACLDVPATQNFARTPDIPLEILSIFLYLAYMQRKLLGEARSCVRYRGHLAAILLKLMACQSVQTCLSKRPDGMSKCLDMPV